MSGRTMGGAGATMPTYRDGLCELSECFAFPVGPRTDGLLACKAHGGVAPVSAARTLPVTPAERVCATVLRAYLAWIDTPEDVPDDGAWEASAVLEDLGEALDMREFLAHEGGPSPAGAALLARVEAAERTPGHAIDPDSAGVVWTATIKDRSEDDGPIQVGVVRDGDNYQPRFFGLGKWRDPAPDFGYRILAAWALAGTTPIDAPPAKEPR